MNITRFDETVNTLLAKTRKEKIRRKRKLKGKITNSLNGMPVSNKSPSLKTGLHSDPVIAQTPIPIQIGV